MTRLDFDEQGSGQSQAPRTRRAAARLGGSLVIGLSACFGVAGIDSATAHAGEIDWGEVQGTFDTTLAIGAAIRTEDPDDSNFCTALGGSSADCGKSDGNLNYAQGRFTSTTIQATHELDLRWRNLGAFGRLNYFYDAENYHGSRRHIELSSRARNESGADWEVLDGYLSGEFDAGGMPLLIRVGEQVINWGESTFIPNGLNVINPVDVNRLRSPGAELREALLPIPAAYFSLGVTENVSIEAFWQWGWRETELDPAGTFFSNSDGLGPGGKFFDASLGHNDCSTNRVFFGARQDGTVGFSCLNRGAEVKPKDRNQWGIAARFFIPWLNSAEIGLYAINYHSRLPYPGGTVGASIGTAGLAGAAQQILIQPEYPEDIRKYGVSLSSTIEALDIAVQGELTGSTDFPLQLAETQGVRALLQGAGLPAAAVPLRPGVPPATLGQFSSGAFDHRVYTGQISLTKLVEPGPIVGGWLGASQLAMIAEAGFIRVRNLESSLFRPFQGAVTPASIAEGATSNLEAPFAQKFSWGYVAVARLTYNNAFMGWNLEPGIAYSHDVNGTSPAPIGNYVEGRKALTLSLRGEYLSRWGVNLSYTAFFGAGKANPLRDRDFASLSIQYSF